MKTDGYIVIELDPGMAIAPHPRNHDAFAANCLKSMTKRATVLLMSAAEQGSFRSLL
jgi:hypothetical protein